MIKFNPFSVEHWNLLCISTEFCFHHFSLFHLFYSLPNFVIWKYVIRCTMSSISSMETKIDHIEFVSKTLQTQNRNSIQLKCFSAPHYMWLLSSVTSFVHITAPFLSVPLFFQSNECNFFLYFISHSRLNICMGMNQLKSKSKIPSSESMAKAIKFNKIEKKRENKTMRTLKHWSTSSCYSFFSIFSFSHGTFLWLYLIFFLCKKNNRVQ